MPYIPPYPRLRKELKLRQARLRKLLEHDPLPMNFEEFKRLADYALERADTALRFLDDEMIEEAALCAIQCAEGFREACAVTGIPYINHGQTTLLSSQRGHEKTYGTKEEKKKRNEELQAFIEIIKKEHPEIKSHTALCDKAAGDRRCPHKLTGRAIRDNTENPYK